MQAEVTSSRVEFGGQLAVQTVMRDITERLGAEAEIRELSQRLTYHMEHSPLAVIEWGPDMRLTRWSGEAERMFGWQAQEVLGKRIEDFRWVYTEDTAHVEEVSQELQDGTNPRRFSANRNYRKDGSVIDCEWYNSSLLDDSGRLQSILSLVLDVSERKRAVEALRESEEHFRLLHDTMLQAVVYQDADGTITSINPAAERILGRSREELLGLNSEGVQPDTFREDGSPFPAREHPAMVALASGQEVKDVLMQIYNPREDRYRLVNIQAVPLFREGEDGPYRAYTIFEDVTERERAQQERERLLAEEQQLVEELAASNEELLAQNEELQASQYNRSLIEAALDPLVTIGPDGKITDVNEATIKITGRARHQLIGADFADYFTDPESARQGYREVFARGSVTDYPLTICGQDGKLTDVLYNASLYKDQEGNVLGVFAAARDITTLRELEVQRNIASKLQQALLDIPRPTAGIQFGHLYRSATLEASVGGDFYDVFGAKSENVAVLVGDVCGHGVEAARVATLVKDVIHAFTHQFRRPSVVLRNTNELLLEIQVLGFVTLFLGMLDPETGLFTYSSAGHPNALLRTREGDVEPLEAGSAPLGIFPKHSWKESHVQLQPEDLLLLYTDGVIEARRDGKFFGEDGLARVLGRWSEPSPEFLPQAILNQVLAFSGGVLTDDVALLALSSKEDAQRKPGKKAWRQERLVG